MAQMLEWAALYIYPKNLESRTKTCLLDKMFNKYY